jgi:hypothetical protein
VVYGALLRWSTHQPPSKVLREEVRSGARNVAEQNHSIAMVNALDQHRCMAYSTPSVYLTKGLPQHEMARYALHNTA